MRWPWQRQGSDEQLVVSWSGQTLAYVLARARARADGAHEVLKFGVERQGGDGANAVNAVHGTQDLIRQLQGLGLKGFDVRVMLRPEQYQLLQIDAPAVPPEELRLAARYQIREMLHAHVDDVTLDVMRVGDGQQKGAGHLFVVAATNAVLRGVLELGDAMHWTVSVIDIQETAQRNLQSALAGRDGRADRANAALVLVEGQQAVLTISANDELFYTRRFDLPEGFLAGFADSTGSFLEDDRAQRFLVEVQRSLDLWDRSWSGMPLNGMRVYAGERSEELSQWLAAQLGQTVLPMDVNALFPGFEGGAAGDRALCLPLLGVLMRSESRKL